MNSCIHIRRIGRILLLSWFETLLGKFLFSHIHIWNTLHDEPEKWVWKENWFSFFHLSLLFFLICMYDKVCILKKSFIYPFYCTLTSSFPLHFTVSTSKGYTRTFSLIKCAARDDGSNMNIVGRERERMRQREGGKCIEAICITLCVLQCSFTVTWNKYENKKREKHKKIFLSRNIVWKKNYTERKFLHAFSLTFACFSFLSYISFHNEKIMSMKGEMGTRKFFMLRREWEKKKLLLCELKSVIFFIPYLLKTFLLGSIKCNSVLKGRRDEKYKKWSYT